MSVSSAQWALPAPRIVIDANVLFSACISSGGPARALYSLATEGKVILILCDYCIEEVRDNLARHNYRLALAWLDIMLENLQYVHAPNPSRLDVQNGIGLLEDPRDVPYLFVARDSDATCIVSRDHHLLDIGQIVFGEQRIPIMGVEDCLRMVRAAF